MADGFRVLYFGLPLGALALLHDGLNVALACIARPTMPGMRRLRKKMADRGALLLVTPDLEDPEVREVLASVKPHLIVSWFWPRKIPAGVAGMARRAFNVHPSLLPKYRGADPYYWTLARRDARTGVTAHLLTDRYDEGPVLASREIPVPADCDSWQLARALDRPSLALMRDLAKRFSAGEDLPAIAQDESQATYAHTPTDEDCELRWDWPVDEVLARIRAAAPEPGAFTGFNEDTLVLLQAKRAEKTPAILEPGDIVRTAEGVLIRAADQALVVLAARREGQDAIHKGAALDELFQGIPRL